MSGAGIQLCRFRFPASLLSQDRPGTVSRLCADKPNDIGSPAPLSEFKNWLIEASLIEDLSLMDLWNFYGEFCLDTNSEQLTKGQLVPARRPNW